MQYILKPCLFEESRFSQLQIIPRDAHPISTSVSKEDAWDGVAREIRDVVNNVSVKKVTTKDNIENTYQYPSSFNIAKQQMTAYVELYERTRQLMQPGNERTVNLEILLKRDHQKFFPN